jgi:hypothetical protein
MHKTVLKIVKMTLLVVKIWLILLAACVVLASIGYVWFQIEVVKPYNDFRTAEQKIIPLLDDLNEKVAQTLPTLPSGSLVTDKNSNGIINYPYNHGRWMYINISTTLTHEDVSSYYRSYLSGKGWSVNYPSRRLSETDDYFLNSSCIKISYFDAYYSIMIWHNFQSQVFSPKPPNLNTLGLFEPSDSIFAECP